MNTMKNMTKRMISLLLCLLLTASVMTMVACDSFDRDDGIEEVDMLAGKTPKEAYDFAYTYLAGLTNFTMTANQTINASAQGFSYDTEQVVVNKQNGIDYYLKSEGVQGAEMEMIWVDDVAYYEMMGKKFKIAMTLEEAAAFSGMEMNSAGLVQLPEEYFNDIKFKKTSKGYELVFDIDKDQAEDLFIDMIADLYGSTATLTEDLRYTVVFDKNAIPVAMNIKMTLIVVSEGVSVTTTVDSKSTFSDIGTTVVLPPANPNAYTEYDLDDLQ